MPALPPSASAVTPSPCVRNCTLDDHDVCLGCGRTLADITAWGDMDEAQRADCVARARQRFEAQGRLWPSPPLSLSRRGGSQGHR